MDSDGRPLADLIFNTPEYRNLFTHFMDFYSNRVFREDQWTSYGDSIKAVIRPYVANDTFYPQDYGYDMGDFDDSYNTDYRKGHVERGLYEFMRKRAEQTNQDLNWQSAAPSIYYQTLTSIADSLFLSASIFDESGIKYVTLVTFDADMDTLVQLDMQRSRNNASPRVEAYDQWLLAFVPTAEAAYYKIVAEDSTSVTSAWPRSELAAFPRIGTSDIAVYINEFIASNDGSYFDQDGGFDDWIEIYNASDQTIDLSGMFLTDKPGNLTKWTIPNGTEISPGAFLIFWCDEEEGQSGLHTNFKLGAGGEFIGLTEADSVSIIDSLTFGAQETDISYGRTVDAGSTWQFFSSPTPGYSNLLISLSTHILPETLSLDPCYPNPFNPQTTIAFQVPLPQHILIELYDVNGKRMETVFDKYVQAGAYSFVYNANALSSGIYFVVLTTDSGLRHTRKIGYIK